jgi:nucleoid-associated protein YgaU
MGIFDSIKKALGGSKPEADTTVAPSQLLREAGIDTSGLKLSFSPGSIAVAGTVSSDAEREKIIEVLSGIDGISSVQDNMVIATAPEPEPVPEPAPVEAEEAAPAETGGRTYTVQSGDSLWKIAEEMYGNGSKYMKIFEANKDLLDNPDKIFPGQELKIPELDD